MENNILDDLEKVAKDGIEVIVADQELIPTLIISTPTGVEIIGIVAENHTLNSIRYLLTQRQVKAYALVLEGYATKSIEAANKVEGKIRNLPLDDRFDVASISLVENGGTTKLLTSVIDADKDGVRSLRKWETSQSVSGRYIIENW
jgi:hypothetical protein